jgi:DDE superfamily endonuclease
MLTPSPKILQLLSTFAVGMTAPTFAKALVLIYGAILAPGRRTITAALRVQGLEGESNFGKYHRVLNQAPWSAMVMSRLLLGLLVGSFVPEGRPLLVLIDETLERRQGKKIGYKGWFRDAVRSTATKVAVSLGIRWCCLCLLVSVPWSRRPWALPFLVVPVLSEKTATRLGTPHRSGVSWAACLVRKLRTWYPDREIILVGDGEYAAVDLVATCQQRRVTQVARLRLDAGLYDMPAPQPASKRGPKPKKGARQLSLRQRLADPHTAWQRARVSWYGNQVRDVEWVSEVSLWYTPGHDPVRLRWVLVRYEEEEPRTGRKKSHVAVFFCTDTAVSATQVLAWFVGRWNIEVTFEETRAHLGFETQRQWSPRAIGRTTPCLLGLFSLVVLMAKILYPHSLPVRHNAWYSKEEATFSDALAAVRAHLWGGMHYTISSQYPQTCLIPIALWDRVQQVLCYAA